MFPLLNLVNKVRLPRQNETLATNKFLTINQPQTSKKYREKTKNTKRALQQKSIQKTARNNLSKTKQQKNNSYKTR